MPRFAYSAYATDGSIETGEVSAASDVAALDQLAARGLTPVSLKQGGSAVPWYRRDISLTGRPPAAKPQVLAEAFRALSSLLLVNFPLPRALDFAAHSTPDPAMRRALERVGQSVADGQKLADAMAEEGTTFPARLVTMVGIGEAANTLPQVTGRIAETLTAEVTQRRELRAALVYPAILIVMSALVLGVLVFFLAPTLVPVFASSGTPPPAVLRAMIGLRDVLSDDWPVILAAVAGGGLLLRWLWPRLRHRAAPVLLRLPVIGPYQRQVNTLEAAQTMALMLGSGATLVQALRTAHDTATHPAYRALLEQAETTITGGGTLSSVLSASPLIDPMAAALIEAGEETDRLAPVLDQLSDELRDRTRRTLAQAIRLVTPVLTLAIGLIVGAVILSTVSAIMTLNDVAL
ncbi:type II secretion system F family protein [Pseudaestuariivita atlantica]|uniref:Type II secretion system protein GspF domain-containing protein n=1 Tax=Pseudaestuariivita atlantica TaxID=1317121 RepID=A0A0L1JPY7_9RHOB|nr:type II secretion system F family protein [Pseudaestuariivita atlantica]KNG93787.1 hypothetical protein ATO11_11470 [Pseudaestuariivita atlantica]